MPLAKRKKGEKAALPEGVMARVQLAPFRVAQAGIRTAEVGYAPLAETLTTVGNVAFDERRLATHLLEGPGQVAGREAPRQLHRAGRRGGRDAGRALQPRAVPGDPGAAHRPGGRARTRPAADRRWAARCWATGEELVQPRRREAQALGDHPGPDRRDPPARARPTSRSRSSRRSAAHVVKKNVVEGQ